MDYEKYKKALERAKSAIKECGYNEGRIAMIESIFPELKENEDERIRRRIYNYINATLDDDYNSEKKKWLAWLEKQEESNIQNNNPFKIESDKFYFCIKDYFAGGCCRSRKGDVVLAQRGMSMMGLSSEQALEYFIPINPFNKEVIAWFEEQGKQISVSITDEWIEDYWQHEKVNNPYSYNKGDEIQFDHQGFISFCKKYCKKPTDKIKPKFKVGDWITDDSKIIWKITYIGESNYILQARNGNTVNETISYVDENFRLWTIVDVKDGDVLAVDKRPFIFKGFLDSKHPGCPTAYCGVNTEDKFICSSGNYWWTNNKDDIKPAIKEERELLFQKMKEAGYEWNKDTKELKNYRLH